MKIKHACPDDADVFHAAIKALHHLESTNVDIEQSDALAKVADVRLDVEKMKGVCQHLADDGYLSQMISTDDPRGLSMYKLADSPDGIRLEDLLYFCVEEMRLRSLIQFFESSYSSAVLRERQDVKVRFEITSDGITISSVFATLEMHKDGLMIEDYGISQTSLEQVFNYHAAKAHDHDQTFNNMPYRIPVLVGASGEENVDSIVEVKSDTQPSKGTPVGITALSAENIQSASDASSEHESC